MTITITSPLTTWLAERWSALWTQLHEPEGYAFRLDLDEDTLRRFRFLYLAYLRRNPHRYAGGDLTDIPEFGPVLQSMPRAELGAFTCYVIARLAQPRDRFDFQRYAVDHRLLEQLLLLRPWADEEGMLRIGEALFFMSPLRCFVLAPDRLPAGRECLLRRAARRARRRADPEYDGR